MSGGRGFLPRAVLVINWELKNKHYVLVFVKPVCGESFVGALCLCGSVRGPSPEPPPHVMSLAFRRENGATEQGVEGPARLGQVGSEL